jgi:hypothetical protein
MFYQMPSLERKQLATNFGMECCGGFGSGSEGI